MPAKVRRKRMREVDAAVSAVADVRAEESRFATDADDALFVVDQGTRFSAPFLSPTQSKHQSQVEPLVAMPCAQGEGPSGPGKGLDRFS